MIKLFKYFLASATALILDYSCYLFLLSQNSTSPEILATISYLLGLCVAYFLMKNYVFKFKNKINVKTEQYRFFMSGILGSLCTFFSTKAFFYVYPNPEFAKLFAVAISFIVVYMFRNIYVFKE